MNTPGMQIIKLRAREQTSEPQYWLPLPGLWAPAVANSTSRHNIDYRCC